MPYALRLHQDIEKQLARIPAKRRERLVQTMRSLREDPRPPDCIQLDDALYRVRDGQYRIIYAIFDDEVVIVICKMAKRTEATYRDMQKLLERARRELAE